MHREECWWIDCVSTWLTAGGTLHIERSLSNCRMLKLDTPMLFTLPEAWSASIPCSRKQVYCPLPEAHLVQVEKILNLFPVSGGIKHLYSQRVCSYPPYVHVVYVRGLHYSILLWEKLITHFLRRILSVKQKLYRKSWSDRDVSAQPSGRRGNAPGKDPGSPDWGRSEIYPGTEGCPLDHDGCTTARRINREINIINNKNTGAA